MTGAIKLFRCVRKFHRIVGIYPPSKHRQYLINAKITLNLMSMILLLFPIILYFLFESDSIDDYGQCFFGIVSMSEILLYFVINFSNIQSILKLIKKLEDFIEMSEFNFK